MIATVESLQAEINRLTGLAYTDSLTGLPNRRAFEERLEQEWNRCNRSQSPISLLFFDIDRFKLWNTYAGHIRTDEMLQDFTAKLQQIPMRSFDLLARFAGDEFVLLMPDCPIGGIVRVAEQIAEAAKLTDIRLSQGAVSAIPEGANYQGLVIAANKMMHQAKAEGRDRVCIG